MSPTSPQPPGAGVATRDAADKVHRDSHSIHMQASSPPSSSSTNSSVSSSSNGVINSRPAPRQKQQPVIIYTQSPKVIRTSTRDFISNVQKLTGLDSPVRGERDAGSSAAAAAQDESLSSSESCAHAAPHPYADPRLMPPLAAHFVAPDIPLFAPGPSELQLCVPQGLYDQFPALNAAPLSPVMSANISGAAGNGGAVFSPSMVEATRTFPDYY